MAVACQRQPTILPRLSSIRVSNDVRQPSSATTQPQRAGSIPVSAPPSAAADAGAIVDVATDRRAQPFGAPNTMVSLGAIDPKGRWVYFCQAELDSTVTSKSEGGARSTFLGSTFKPYLWRINAQTQSIDSLAAASPNGRFLVVISSSNSPQLFDVETNQIESLAALDLDVRADAGTGDLRSVAFSPDSSRLALLVHEKSPRIIVRDLVNKSDCEVIPVSNSVWRIAFDASARYVVSTEVLEDTNRNGRLDWPLPQRPLAESRCKSPIPAYSAYIAKGDATQVSIAPVHGGQARVVPGFISALGQSLVVKQPNGALGVSDGRRTRPFGSPDCDAQIIAVAPEYGCILTGCRDGKGRSLVELDSAQAYRKLELDVPASSTDWTSPQTTAYLALYSGAHSYLVDLTLARAIPLVDRDQVLAQGASGILLRRGTAIVLFNPSSQSSVTLLNDVPPGTRIVTGEGVAQVGDRVVSADQGRVLGTLAKLALAITSNGCGVVSLDRDSDKAQFARGPLSWSCPVP